MVGTGSLLVHSGTRPIVAFWGVLLHLGGIVIAFDGLLGVWATDRPRQVSSIQFTGLFALSIGFALASLFAWIMPLLFLG